LVIFLFQIFKGFTLLPWQKVGRIWLGFPQSNFSLKSFPSLSLYSNDMTPIQFFQSFPLCFGVLLLYFSFRPFKTQLLVSRTLL
jgi:hypothetical protein